eukprot:7097322-Pyramimonas_sp.AAC.2
MEIFSCTCKGSIKEGSASGQARALLSLIRRGVLSAPSLSLPVWSFIQELYSGALLHCSMLYRG